LDEDLTKILGERDYSEVRLFRGEGNSK